MSIFYDKNEKHFSSKEEALNSILLQEEFINQEVLNEEYFGQHPELRKIEMILANTINEKTGCIIPSKFIGKVQSQVEECFERCFNIETVSLGVHKDADYNAFCIPLYKNAVITSENLLSGVEITKDKYGYKFSTKRENLLIGITTNLLGMCSPREFIAVMLHEVGHAFADHPKAMKFFFYLTRVVDEEGFDKALKDIDNTSAINKLDAKKAKKKNTYNKEINEHSKWISGFLLICVQIIWFIYHKTSLFIVLGLGAIFNSIRNVVFDSQAQERFSDNFAASYGYAIEQREILLKMYKKERETPAINCILYYCHLFLGVITKPIASHPNVIKRENDMKFYLKSELKYIKDAKLRKEIESQMDFMKKTSIKFNIKYLGFLQSLSSIIRYPFDVIAQLASAIFSGKTIQSIDKEIKEKKVYKED